MRPGETRLLAGVVTAMARILVLALKKPRVRTPVALSIARVITFAMLTNRPWARVETLFILVVPTTGGRERTRFLVLRKMGIALRSGRALLQSRLVGRRARTLRVATVRGVPRG